MNPPAIQGLGNFGGFQFQLQDRAGNSGLNALAPSDGAGLCSGRQIKHLDCKLYLALLPQIHPIVVEVDRNKAKSCKSQ